ncbi:hypothetical protein M422DRAFT_276580 [Sphaerobolus stellatus SS14]|uniref:Uncharacterized protein n=1 Tax=Sphaerobolus stellatus (strain SS14) TaxID=990650 RepID=A0A0C9T2E3_SPHS4|nr:hypothetical protein M422DRAFT_276580 [Sphaerobolus stellatus SS14]
MCSLEKMVWRENKTCLQMWLNGGAIMTLQERNMPKLRELIVEYEDRSFQEGFFSVLKVPILETFKFMKFPGSRSRAVSQRWLWEPENVVQKQKNQGDPHQPIPFKYIKSIFGTQPITELKTIKFSGFIVDSAVFSELCCTMFSSVTQLKWQDCQLNATFYEELLLRSIAQSMSL